MIRVLVNGSNGKMGQEVIKLISKSSEFYLFGGLDKCKKDNLNYRIYSSITDLKHLNDKPDVIVDFSVPDASLAVLSYAKSIKIPIVIATTGFSMIIKSLLMNVVKIYLFFNLQICLLI